MGSFDISCGISNLAIQYGDKTGLVLLNKREEYTHINAGIPSVGKTMDLYSNSSYRPYMAPIIGVYDDYGRLRDIEPSAATEFLERQFERPIETIVDCVSSTRNIYDSAGGIYEAYITDKTLFRTFTALPHDELLALGFKQDTDVPEGAISSYSFGEHKLVEEKQSVWNIHFNSHRGLIVYHVIARDTETLVSAFGYHTGIYPGFKEQDYDKLQPLYDLSGMFYLPKVLREMTDVISDDFFIKSARERFNEKWKEFMDSLQDMPGETISDKKLRILSSGNDFLRENVSLTVDQYELLGGFQNDDGFHKLKSLMEVLQVLNRYLQPAIGGSQDGQIEAFKALNKVTDEILTKRQHYHNEGIEDCTVGD